MPRFEKKRGALRAWLAALVCTLSMVQAQEPAKPDPAILKDFNNRVSEYMKVHKTAAAEVHGLRPTESKDAIDRHQHSLAHHIREARKDATPGNIFTPEIAPEFRRLIALTFQGSGAARIQQSLRAGTPVSKQLLHVNGEYPEGLPMQSTPPSLLLNLPPLPKELEYRLVGHDLVICDMEANLIVDYLRDAIP